MSYHSQCGEDKWIDENLNLSIGTFCEVGAYDGILSSNTLHFEQYGWRGLLFEPDPEMFYMCVDNRQSPCLCLCAGSEMRAVTFNVNPDDHGLSGLIRPGKPINHLQVRLDDFLKIFHLSKLNFLSIDTEGTELDVWKGIGEIRPGIVMMEYQTCDLPPQDKQIVEQMKLDGYREVHRTQYNLIFIKT